MKNLKYFTLSTSILHSHRPLLLHSPPLKRSKRKLYKRKLLSITYQKSRWGPIATRTTKRTRKTAKTTKTKKSVKTAKKSSRKTTTIYVCPACHSPHIKPLRLGDEPRYLCQRCGRIFTFPEKKSRQAVHELHRKRKQHLLATHARTRDNRHAHLHHHVHHYHLRAIFLILGTFLLGLSMVIFPVNNTESLFFLVFSILSFYVGTRWYLP